MTEIKSSFTQEKMDYYNERITIRLVSNIFTNSDKPKMWTVICKKCQGSLIPFEKDMEIKTVDTVLKNHECKQ